MLSTELLTNLDWIIVKTESAYHKYDFAHNYLALSIIPLYAIKIVNTHFGRYAFPFPHKIKISLKKAITRRKESIHTDKNSGIKQG